MVDNLTTNIGKLSDSELVKIARELVITEYCDRKEYLYLKWRADSDLLWKTERKTLPYPDSPPYPTEDEVQQKVNLLKSFLKSSKPAEESKPEPEVKEETVQEVAQPEPEPIPVEEPPKAETPAEKETVQQPEKQEPKQQDTPVNPVPLKNNVNDLNEILALSKIRALERDMAESTTASRMLPELNKTLEDLRQTLFRKP